MTNPDFDFRFDFKSGFAPKDTKRALRRLLNRSNSALFRVVDDEGLEIEKDAKRRVPVLTGNLRASIRHDTSQGRDKIVLLVGTPVRYAVYVEMKMGRGPEQPFLRPALEERLSTTERRIVETVYEEAEAI